jgi:hypothetical protein
MGVPRRESYAENVPTENLMPRRWGAQVPVFGAVIASTAMRVVAMGGLLPLIHPPVPTGVQGVVCVMDGADMLMYWDHDASSIIAQWLVDRHILAMLP